MSDIHKSVVALYPIKRLVWAVVKTKVEHSSETYSQGLYAEVEVESGDGQSPTTWMKVRLYDRSSSGAIEFSHISSSQLKLDTITDEEVVQGLVMQAVLNDET